MLGRTLIIGELVPTQDRQGVVDSDGEGPGASSGVSLGVDAVDAASPLGRGDDADELLCLSEFFASRSVITSRSKPSR